MADFLISTSPEEITCNDHTILSNAAEREACVNCQLFKDKVEKYQFHNHTFTCAKKKKTITIKANEGHGRLDGIKNGPDLSNIPICRFHFPKFPLDEILRVQLLFFKDHSGHRCSRSKMTTF